MPIYEYQCQACEHRFEQIVLGGGIPECPSCKVGIVQKQISAFAVSGSGGQWDGEPLPDPVVPVETHEVLALVL